MAHNAYVGGSLAGWALGTGVSAAKFWEIDQAQFKAINGDDGGVWAPTGTITIGGKGLKLTTTLTAVTATLSGKINASGGAAVTGTSEFGTPGGGDAFYVYAPATFTSTVDITGGTFHTHGSAVTFYGGTFQTTGTATLSGTTTIAGTLATTATTTLGTTSNPVNLLGRIAVPAANATIAGDTTLTAAFPSVYRLTGLGGSPRNLTFDSSGFATGSMQIVRNDDSTYNVTVRDPGTGNLVVLTPGTCGIFTKEPTAWVLLLTV